MSIIVFWKPSARLNAPALNNCQIGEALGARKGVERSTVMRERRRKNASEVLSIAWREPGP